MNLQDIDMTTFDYNASCVIQPIKQKMFQFSVGQSESINLYDKGNSNLCNNKSWKPVLFSKKLYSQPKFIVSLQRKKARIISGIRDRQIQPKQQKTIGMIGSKVKNSCYRNTPVKNFVNFQLNMQNFVQRNEILLNKHQFKQKKNPKMNFSLKYITQRKKNIQLQCRSKQKSKDRLVNSRVMTSSFRQKGSDSPYLHMIISQASNIKSYNRPRTSCTSERYQKKIQRPRSEIQ